MPLPSVLDPATSRLTRVRRTCRRAVLRRRRLLAALAAAGAVATGLAAATDEPDPEVTVYVAAHDLPAGAVLTTSDLRPAAFAPGSEPAGASGGEAVGRTLAAPLREGEPVTDVRLVGPALVDAGPGQVAAPVRLPDAAAVALLRVGDAVDLVATDPAAGADPSTGLGGSEVVARDVTVLAIPPPDPDGAASAEVGAGGGRLVVLGLTTSEVTEVADAAARSFVTFTWSSR